MNDRKHISILVPCHNEEQNIMPLWSELTAVTSQLDAYDWEYIFVDDGSRDNTLEMLRQLRNEDRRITILSLSRNFGKENAMLAGMDCSRGDALIMMDADLQHPPKLIPELVKKWEEGYDDVWAMRTNRDTDSRMRRMLTKAFYGFIKRINPMVATSGSGDFRLLDRWAVDTLRSLRESQRYTKGLYQWIGGSKAAVPYTPEPRHSGKSSFGLSRSMRLALDGILGFSTAPLRMATYLGLTTFILSLLYLLYTVAKYAIYGDPVQGFATTICVILILGGAQLLCLGIIGEYLGRTFMEGKRRPPYIIHRLERGNDETSAPPTPRGEKP